MKSTLRMTVRATARLLGMIALVLSPVEAQHRHAAWYSAKVEKQPGMSVIIFTFDIGSVRVDLPNPVVSGQRFFGTMGDFLGRRSRDSYSLEFAGQTARVEDWGFSWVAPTVQAETHVPLILKDFTGGELASADILVTVSAEDVPGVQPGLPGVVQSGRPAILFGAFDGLGRTATVTISGQSADVLTQNLATTVVMVPPDVVGMTHYTVRSAGGESGGDLRCISVKDNEATLRRGKRRHYEVVIAGLLGLDREIAVRVQNNTPALAKLGPLRPTPFPKNREEVPGVLFVEPKDVRPDGTYHAIAEIEILPGLIDLHTDLIMPRNALEEVALLLQLPRHTSSKLEAQEHAELLRLRYGDRALPLLGDLIDRGLGGNEAVDTMIAIDFDRATPLILTAVLHRSIQVDLDAFNRKAEKNPAYPYRQLLHDAALQELGLRPTVSSAEAVGITGSPADLPALTAALATAGHPLIHDAVEAAMARFGAEPQLQAIERRLRVVISPTLDGAVVQEFERGVHQAIFTGNTRFVPLLCRHIHDSHWEFGDYNVDPGNGAREAIMLLQRNEPGKDVCAKTSDDK